MADTRIGPLAVALKSARERKGLSQRELGRRSGWNYSLISKLERGDRTYVPGEEELRRLDDALEAGGHLLRIAGYEQARGDLDETLRAVIDGHIRALVEDVQRLLGR